MSIINVSALVNAMGGKKNRYTYSRVQGLLRGITARSTKKEIREVRIVIEQQLKSAIAQLDKLENSL